ncbi:MAG TPA: glycosyltransferase family 1 protein [Saprospiraceae bacterium]|nr:glycosyltransferase family 1 protein [Saprospiraceae bacterium]
MSKTNSFQEQLKSGLELFLESQIEGYRQDDLLKIDLHCHDYNSKIPDETLGRILGVPETWLKSKDLIRTLGKSGCDTFTITNHNNATSCWQLQEEGYDILVGTEFSVTVPDFKVGIHVLAYGFSKEDEAKLNKLRYNVYEFLKYANQKNIPTVWAHPLYHYTVGKQPSFDFFSKMALIFERFEVLNGQRDTWQNMLVKEWITNLTPEKLEKDAKLFNVDVSLYTRHPYKKSLTGGSDDHMGIFAGHTGSYLYVPNLQERLKTSSRSSLALEAIREHRIIPYGGHQNIEKLTIAFLDYIFQVAINFKRPDLIRMVLHKGTTQDKLVAVLISNLFTELKHHKTTMKFIKLFHKVFVGKSPSKLTKLVVKKTYKPIFEEALNIVKSHHLEPAEMTSNFYNTINNINDKLNGIFFKRLQKKIDKSYDEKKLEYFNFEKMIERLEFSPNLRDHIDKKQKKKISSFLDGLSFPFLSSTLIFGTNLLSSKVLYNTRNLLNEFSEELGVLKHPKRMLWLTDTFEDKNGVSKVLQEMHTEIKRLNLPIDLLVCSDTLKSDEHLIVIKPELEIKIPNYQEQPLRIPNINKIHKLFIENNYDRIMCSTEGVMGVISIVLKNAFTVPAYFYLHTDWMMFARKKMGMDQHQADKVRRILRVFYKNFDKIFVLNNDHKKWLASYEMEYDQAKIFKTGHWVSKNFIPVKSDKETIFNLPNDCKVLLYVGRLSKEKGVMDIVSIYRKVVKEIDQVRMVFVGTGSAEESLRKELPEALFLGWVDSTKLPAIYSAADMLLLPSKFDTFGLVVLEALSCGLPVAAYKAKGPKDIIEHEKCGYLSAHASGLSRFIIQYFENPNLKSSFRQNALKQASAYSKNVIMGQLIKDLDL